LLKGLDAAPARPVLLALDDADAPDAVVLREAFLRTGSASSLPSLPALLALLETLESGFLSALALYPGVVLENRLLENEDESRDG